ncbi:MAG: shikimate kinase [Eubacteriales bacterium]|nr:shikimate kinase [Eubacteriales bacterium]
MKNVILIGFMGAGKSTIGRRLAKKMQRRFVDTDLWIEKQTGQKIKDIFAEHGEEYFRDLETGLLKKLLNCEEELVIAVGGGLPVREENRKLLKKLGTVIYLRADAKTLLKRLGGDKHRPMLQGGDLRERIHMLMEAREGLYQQAAEIEYYTDNKSLMKTVEEINELFL